MFSCQALAVTVLPVAPAVQALLPIRLGDECDQATCQEGTCVESSCPGESDFCPDDSCPEGTVPVPDCQDASFCEGDTCAGGDTCPGTTCPGGDSCEDATCGGGPSCAGSTCHFASCGDSHCHGSSGPGPGCHAGGTCFNTQGADECNDSKFCIDTVPCSFTEPIVQPQEEPTTRTDRLLPALHERISILLAEAP